MVSADKLPKIFFTVQYLRGLGALLVVLYHSASQLQRYQPTLIWPEWGAVAIDAFFVISGFVMWHMTAMKPISFGDYWRKRIARSIPIYWAVTAFVVAIMLIAPQLLSTSHFDLVHVLDSFFLIPSLHPVLHTQFAPVVIPGWTFEYEIAFYALLSVCLFVPLRFRAASLIAPILVVAALPAFFKSNSALFEFYTQPLIIQFASGVFLGWLLWKGVTMSPKASLALMVVGVAIVPFLPEPSHVVPELGAYNFMLSRTLWYVVPAFAIVAGAVFFEMATMLKPWKIPTLIGNASYSIYLIHPLILPAVAKVWHMAGLAASPAWNVGFLSITMGASLLIGIGCHLWVEMPLARLAGRLASKKRAPAPALRPVSV
jgi:exopolysaccharide production protein ExoZ